MFSNRYLNNVQRGSSACRLDTNKLLLELNTSGLSSVAWHFSFSLSFSLTFLLTLHTCRKSSAKIITHWKFNENFTEVNNKNAQDRVQLVVFFHVEYIY